MQFHYSFADTKGRCSLLKWRWLLVVVLTSSCNTVTPWNYEDQMRSWKQYNAAGYQAYQVGNYEIAVTMYGKAVQIAEGFGSEDPYMALSLQELARVYLAQGKGSDAQRILERTLAIYERWRHSHEEIYSPFAEDDINALTTLAGFNAANGQFGRAETLYQQALDIENRFAFPTKGLRVQILDSYARLLKQMNRLKEAEQVELQAVQLRLQRRPGKKREVKS